MGCGCLTIPIGVIELVLMAPLCFLTYRAIKQGLPSRYPLELSVSILHAFGILLSYASLILLSGMAIFCLVEIYEGNVNVPANDPIGNEHGRFANLKFTENHITYWWFGFLVSESIWAVVPFLLARRAFSKIVEQFQQEERKLN